jgi:hypothetical protein
MASILYKEVSAMDTKVNEVSVDRSGRQSEEMIAKEVIVKVLVPAVFENVTMDDGADELVFDRWYKKLYELLIGSVPENGKGANPLQEKAPMKKQDVVPVPAMHNDSTVTVSDKITDKQIKKIFVLAREKEILKEAVESHARKPISSLSKKEASAVIDWLISYEDENDLLYGRAG